MKPFSFDRRSFLRGAGALFSASLLPHAAEAVSRSDMLFAATAKTPEGKFVAVLLDEAMRIVRQIALPDRGHDVTFNPVTGESVVFARRPGNFALVFSLAGWVEPRMIIAPQGRHFYGHGVFSQDGKLLYATENDFGNAVGKVGIFDATDEFKRIGEYESFGIGPHDILLSPDGKTLVVANGGIETHPDFGRAKLNLAFMEPNISYINRETGTLLESHSLSPSLNQLSIRHMAMNAKGRVVFGCQYEGAKSDAPPLVGWSELGVGIETWDCLQETLCQSENYVGSVAISPDGLAAAISAPRDNAFALILVKDGRLLREATMQGVCGLAPAKLGFTASSDKGYMGGLHDGVFQSDHDLLFDNHMASFNQSTLRSL